MIVDRMRWSGRLAAACAAGSLVIGALSGCSPSTPDIDAAMAKQLHSSVAALTEAAAHGDIAGAIKDLDALERKVREATASGEISAERTARIQASISLVRADLTAALPKPSPSPSPSPSQTTVPTTNTNSGSDPGDDKGGNKGDKGKGGDNGRGGK